MNFSTTSKTVAHLAAKGLKNPLLLTPKEIETICGSALAQANDTKLAAAFDLPSCVLGIALGAIITVASMFGIAYLFTS